MLDMDGFGGGGGVGGAPNAENLRGLGNVSSGLLHLRFKSRFFFLTLFFNGCFFPCSLIQLGLVDLVLFNHLF